jgi:hypothetical protein
MFSHIFGAVPMYDFSISAGNLELVKALALWGVFGFMYLCSRRTSGFTVTVCHPYEVAHTLPQPRTPAAIPFANSMAPAPRMSEPTSTKVLVTTASH